MLEMTVNVVCVGVLVVMVLLLLYSGISLMTGSAVCSSLTTWSAGGIGCSVKYCKYTTSDQYTI